LAGETLENVPPGKKKRWGTLGRLFRPRDSLPSTGGRRGRPEKRSGHIQAACVKTRERVALFHIRRSILLRRSGEKRRNISLASAWGRWGKGNSSHGRRTFRFVLISKPSRSPGGGDLSKSNAPRAQREALSWTGVSTPPTNSRRGKYKSA